MNDSDERMQLANRAMLGLGAIVVPSVLGVVLGWPWWIVVLIVVILLLVVGASAVRILRTEDEPVAVPRRTVADIAPLPAGTEQVGPVAIPSAEPGYRFTFTAALHWQARSHAPERDHPRLAARARELLVDRAIPIARQMAPEDHVLAGYRLASALGTPEGDPSGSMDTRATDVTVMIGEQDTARLRRLADRAKEVQLAELDRARERELREYLQQDVLASTGNVLVWWLARHLEDPDGAVARLPALDRISTVVQGGRNGRALADGRPTAGSGPGPRLADDTDAGAHHPPSAPWTAASSVRHLLDSLYPDDGVDRRSAAGHLAALVAQWGHEGLARTVREEFGRPSADESASAERGRSPNGDGTTGGSSTRPLWRPHPVEDETHR